MSAVLLPTQYEFYSIGRSGTRRFDREHKQIQQHQLTSAAMGPSISVAELIGSVRMLAEMAAPRAPSLPSVDARLLA